MAQYNLTPYTTKLSANRDLTEDEASSAARALASDSLSLEEKKAFLLALGKKGETADEVAAFATTYRTLARDPEVSSFADRAIDIVGTGGDKSHSYNISTTASFILAAAGVPVLKHGNRSITSSCGSADLQEAVGIDLQANNAKLNRSLESLNFCFFFAPAFHPAFKEIMPVRKALAEEGHRSIFNLLGPLINPGCPAHQLMGVFSADWVKPLADALTKLGLKRGLVVNCDLGDGKVMDELTTAGRNRVAGVGELGDIDTTWPEDSFGLSASTYDELKGGDVRENQKTLRSLLSQKAPEGLESSLALNAGVALWIAGKCESIEAGIAEARNIITGGRLKNWLEQVKEFYAQ